MDQNFDYGFNPSHALSGGISNKASKRNEEAGSEEAVDRSYLVGNIQSLAGMANDQGLPFLTALLRGVAERLETSPPVDQPRVEPTQIHRE